MDGVHKAKYWNGGFLFFCPGCNTKHFLDRRWRFEGTLECPTFQPDIIIDDDIYCHCLISNGQIKFFKNCDHSLVNKTITMEPIK